MRTLTCFTLLLTLAAACGAPGEDVAELGSGDAKQDGNALGRFPLDVTLLVSQVGKGPFESLRVGSEVEGDHRRGSVAGATGEPRAVSVYFRRRPASGSAPEQWFVQLNDYSAGNLIGKFAYRVDGDGYVFLTPEKGGAELAYEPTAAFTTAAWALSLMDPALRVVPTGKPSGDIARFTVHVGGVGNAVSLQDGDTRDDAGDRIQARNFTCEAALVEDPEVFYPGLCRIVRQGTPARPQWVVAYGATIDGALFVRTAKISKLSLTPVDARNPQGPQRASLSIDGLSYAGTLPLVADDWSGDDWCADCEGDTEDRM